MIQVQKCKRFLCNCCIVIIIHRELSFILQKISDVCVHMRKVLVTKEALFTESYPNLYPFIPHQRVTLNTGHYCLYFFYIKQQLYQYDLVSLIVIDWIVGNVYLYIVQSEQGQEGVISLTRLCRCVREETSPITMERGASPFMVANSRMKISL